MLRKTALLLILFTLASCGGREEVYQDQFISMGTIYQLSLYGVKQERGREVSRMVQDDLKFMEFAWHAWRPGPLGRINQLLASGEEFSINPSVLPLVVQSKQLYTASHGLFNPAIGELIAMWGFHSDDPAGSQPPSDEAIRAYMQDLPTMDDIVIDGIRARGLNPHIKLDFGAFAKGYAIEKILARLQAEGIKNAILNAGGDLKVIGRHGSRPWTVAIRDPHSPNGVVASLEVGSGESVFTSGNYERFYQDKKRRIHHIIDPRTGYPAPVIASATVIHDDAAVADAAATAVLIAGPEQWWEIARSMGIRYVLLVDEKGNIHMNPAMAKRVKLEPEFSHRVKLSKALQD